MRLLLRRGRSEPSRRAPEEEKKEGEQEGEDGKDGKDGEGKSKGERRSRRAGEGRGGRREEGARKLNNPTEVLEADLRSAPFALVRSPHARSAKFEV